MSSPASGSFDPDSTLGALLVGVLASYVLFGITTNQVYVYTSRFPNDSCKVKMLVAAVWLFELAHVLCIGHTLYILAVSDFGHPASFESIPASLGASTVFNGLIAMCVQGFFAHRIYRLSKQLYIPLFCWTLSLLFLAASTVAFVTGYRTTQFTKYEVQWGWLLDALWTISAVDDLIISASLVFWFLRRRDTSQPSVALVDKLIAWTIETGAVTSAAAILNLICFTMMKTNFIWIAWYVVTARLYSNSFLASLNSRETLRKMNDTPRSLPYPVYPSNLGVDSATTFQSTRTLPTNQLLSC
ncbi:hypothetical protein GGX14DRAFT_692139 [Mycena pura]|uniref:DUF6534 domain-containing protein n=1 Tax=Mycena pura TaxID=153505 RepID=A0AAD6YVL0_9AGAR|nr:hypothetical protein GGX14DRAFT_692139 [Mycena pura]